MNIILMRHGEAVPFAVNDGDRELTPKGKSEASRTGTQLKNGGWIPDVVVLLNAYSSATNSGAGASVTGV